MEQQQQYLQLILPSWAPPSWLFGPVWTVLYTIIAISFGFVFYKVVKKQIRAPIVFPFVFNLVFNLAYTPIQFGLRNNYLAAIDTLLILGTLIWTLATFWRIGSPLRWVVYANIPYLVWVIFATTLQLTITYLNR